MGMGAALTQAVDVGCDPVSRNVMLVAESPVHISYEQSLFVVRRSDRYLEIVFGVTVLARVMVEDLSLFRDIRTAPVVRVVVVLPDKTILARPAVSIDV
jgi:hypothetical protein